MRALGWFCLELVSLSAYRIGCRSKTKHDFSNERIIMSHSDSTFRPALQLMSGRATAFAVTFLIPVVLSRLFTKSEFGTYKQIFLIVYSLYGVGQVGMAECLYYFLPTFPKAAGRYVTNSLVILGLTGLVCFATLFLAGERIANWLSNPTLTHYAWLAGS